MIRSKMAASAQRLARAGVKMEEFPQSAPNLTQASQNLYELLQARALHLYPSPDIRLAMSRAIAIETAARLAHRQGEVEPQD
jgi:hypothetical protein